MDFKKNLFIVSIFLFIFWMIITIPIFLELLSGGVVGTREAIIEQNNRFATMFAGYIIFGGLLLISFIYKKISKAQR